MKKSETTLKESEATLPKPLVERFKSQDEMWEYLIASKNIIWMGQNTNHLEINKEIKNAALKVIENSEFQKYPPPGGFSELREAIAQDLKLPDQDVLITSGGTEGLHIVVSSIIRAGDHAIISDPGYMIIGKFVERWGGHVSYVPIYSPELNYRLKPEAVKGEIKENTKLLILVDPLNPLGYAHTEDEIKAFADIAKEHDLIIIHDVTYRDFSDKHALAAKYAPERTFTIYSFSKSYALAGLRIGAIVSLKEMVNNAKNFIINDLGTNFLSQRVALAALKTKPVWLPLIKKETRENQKLIKDAVEKVPKAFLPIYPAQASMFVIDLLDTGIRPIDIMSHLLEKYNIFTREGSYTSKRFGHRYLRVSFSIPTKHVEKFAEAFPKAMNELKK